MTDETEITPQNDETAIAPANDANETVPIVEIPEKAPHKPALTIHVYSWATPIFGLLMLVIGLFAGYFGRPLIAGSVSSPTKVVQATVASKSTQSANASLKDVVVGQTRHFMGDANAPVTIIEFSDFQ